jgi:hypothetical protein
MTTFWCAALGLERHPRSTGDDFRVLRGPHGNVALQVADTPVTYRDQMHIDLYTTERDAEVARLLALGATHVRDSGDPDDAYIVLADPEGNYLCVCPVSAPPDQ